MTPQISSSKSQLPSSVNRTLKKSLCLLWLPLSTTVRLLHKAVGSFLCCWYQLHMEYMKQLNYSPHPPFITIYTLCTVVSCTLQVWQHLFLNLDCIIFKNFVYWKGILNFVFPMHTHTKYAHSARVMLQQSCANERCAWSRVGLCRKFKFVDLWLKAPACVSVNGGQMNKEYF